MTTFSETLRTIAAARTIAAVNSARADINKQAVAGTIAPDAAQALGTVARFRLDELAETGDEVEAQPTAGAKPLAVGDRHPAVIREAAAVSYDDSGDSIRGVVAVFIDGQERLAKFRINRAWEGSVRALFGSCGLSPDDDPEQLVGAAIEVTMGTYDSANGPVPVVKKWHRPATRTAMLDRPREVAALPHPAPKPTGPAWERDEQATTRAPRRSSAQKAHAEFKANNEDGDDIPF